MNNLLEEYYYKEEDELSILFSDANVFELEPEPESEEEEEESARIEIHKRF